MENIGGERTDPSVWTNIVVKAVDRRTEFLFMVKGHHAHKVQLCQIQRQISSH